MDPFEIHYGTAQWKDCGDERPWIILGEGFEPETWDCFPLTGRYYNHYDSFEIDPGHPDFDATGLSKRSYIMYETVIMLPTGCFRRRTGVLRNELLQDFKNAAGLD